MIRASAAASSVHAQLLWAELGRVGAFSPFGAHARPSWPPELCYIVLLRSRSAYRARRLSDRSERAALRAIYYNFAAIGGLARVASFEPGGSCEQPIERCRDAGAKQEQLQSQARCCLLDPASACARCNSQLMQMAVLMSRARPARALLNASTGGCSRARPGPLGGGGRSS